MSALLVGNMLCVTCHVRILLLVHEYALEVRNFHFFIIAVFVHYVEEQGPPFPTNGFYLRIAYYIQ